jgi:hypothetical protein
MYRPFLYFLFPISYLAYRLVRPAVNPPNSCSVHPPKVFGRHPPINSLPSKSSTLSVLVF